VCLCVHVIRYWSIHTHSTSHPTTPHTHTVCVRPGCVRVLRLPAQQRRAGAGACVCAAHAQWRYVKLCVYVCVCACVCVCVCGELRRGEECSSVLVRLTFLSLSHTHAHIHNTHTHTHSHTTVILTSVAGGWSSLGKLKRPQIVTVLVNAGMLAAVTVCYAQGMCVCAGMLAAVTLCASHCVCVFVCVSICCMF
jgi:hypothetical protein